MDRQKLWIIAGVLALGAIASLMFDGGSQTTVKKTSGFESAELLSTDDQMKLDRFEIKGSGVELVLTKNGDGQWVMANHDNYLADVNKLVRFFDSLGRNKLQGKMPKSSNPDEEYGFATATKIKFMAGDKVVLDAELGDRMQSRGQTIRLAGNDQVYFLKDAIHETADQSAWENKTLVDVKDKAIKSLTIGKKLTLAREKEGTAFKLIGLKGKEKENTGALTQVGRVLENFSYEERIDVSNEEAKSAFAKPKSALVKTFLGEEYLISVGQVGKDDKKKYFIKIEAKTTDKTSPADNLRAKRLSQIMNKWYFKVGNYHAEKFLKARKDYLEVAKKS